MKKIIATFALLFVMFTNVNATETPRTNDSNCTVEKCKTMSKKDCMAHKKEKCSRDGKQSSTHKMPKWSASQDANSSMKMSTCCKNKKKAESKEETKEETPPMKCAAGKCGGRKCGGGK